MKRLIIAVLTASLAGMFVVAVVGSADAAPVQCDRVKAAPNGYVTCFEVTSTSFKVVVVDSAVTRNRSKITVHTHCTFGSSVTKNMEVTGSYSAGISGTLLKVIGLEAKASVSPSLSLSKTRSSEVGGSFDLKPGQSLTCYRTYGYVQATVKAYDRWDVGSQTRNVRTLKVKAPSSLGVTFQ